MVVILREKIEKVDEKILLVSIIGCLEAIKNESVSIDEGENFIFSPGLVQILREKRCNEKIIKIIEKGCELEDIYSLLPQKLNVVIDELKQEAILLIKDYEECGGIKWLEVNGF